MNKIKNILLITILIGIISACGKDDDVVLDIFEGKWKCNYTKEVTDPLNSKNKILGTIIEEYEFGQELIHRITITTSNLSHPSQRTLTIGKEHYFFKDDSLFYCDPSVDYNIIGYTKTEYGFYKAEQNYFNRGHYIKQIDNTKIIIDSLIFDRIK